MLFRTIWWRIRSVGAWSKDWGEYARRVQATPGGEKESVEGFATGICFWSAAIISTCSSYSIKMSKKIWIFDNAPLSGE